MRVVSGKAKGTKLVAPKSEKTRPTLDKTKEALFSILTNMAPKLFLDDSQASCLDLCAGSGQIGIEALSRNFKHATFVEAARPVKEILQTNLAKTHFTEQASVIIKNVRSFLQAWDCAAEKQAYDFIYCDPPYALAESINALVLAYAQKGLLKETGILVLEQAVETEALAVKTEALAALKEDLRASETVEHIETVEHVEHLESLEIVKEQVYGLTRLCFYKFCAAKR